MSNSINNKNIFILLLLMFVFLGGLLQKAITQEQIIIKKAEPSHKRDGLGNVFAKFAAGGDFTIGYFGASVTNGAGASSDSTKWRWITHRWFEKQFPKARIQHLHVVNGGTGSDLGACRLRREMLDHKPALLFIEFAVNDAGRPQEFLIRTMEGIVRQIWKADPTTDIIFLYTLSTSYLKDYAEGNLPSTPSAFEVVADHYGIPSIDVAYVSAQPINAGKLKWEDFSIDVVHPKDLGYKMYADHIISCLTQWKENAAAKPHTLPEPLRKDNWENAGMVFANTVERSSGWTTETDPVMAKRFPHFPNLLLATKPGETLKFRFKGTHFGIYDVTGPDSGELDVIVDGKLIGTVNLWDQWAKSYRSAFATLAKDLEDTVHNVELRISDKKSPESKGNAMRIGFITMRGEIVK